MRRKFSLLSVFTILILGCSAISQNLSITPGPEQDSGIELTNKPDEIENEAYVLGIANVHPGSFIVAIQVDQPLGNPNLSIQVGDIEYDCVSFSDIPHQHYCVGERPADLGPFEIDLLHEPSNGATPLGRHHPPHENIYQICQKSGPCFSAYNAKKCERLEVSNPEGARVLFDVCLGEQDNIFAREIEYIPPTPTRRNSISR